MNPIVTNIDKHIQGPIIKANKKKRTYVTHECRVNEISLHRNFTLKEKKKEIYHANE